MKMETTGLQLMRKEFEKHHISKLPKPTKAQTDEVKADFKKGMRCKECGGWHHKDVVHLDYVGHAALTDRLLDCDPSWSWEPVSFDQQTGLPKIDANGGLWIRLTVCGVTRLGYGHADAKTGGDAVKEAIGDALRNAAMRFGAALELWHKGVLHMDDDAEENKPAQQKVIFLTEDQQIEINDLIKQSNSDIPALLKYISEISGFEVSDISKTPITAYKTVKAALLKKIEKAKL